jgi:hypothetical protein
MTETSSITSLYTKDILLGLVQNVLLEEGFLSSIQQIRCGSTCVQYLVSVNRIDMITIKPPLLHTTF